MKDLEELMIKI